MSKKAKKSTPERNAAALCPACKIPLKIRLSIKTGKVLSLRCVNCGASSSSQAIRAARRILSNKNASLDSRKNAAKTINTLLNPFRSP